jgi:hypothetical protein
MTEPAHGQVEVLSDRTQVCAGMERRSLATSWRVLQQAKFDQSATTQPAYSQAEVLGARPAGGWGDRHLSLIRCISLPSRC